MFERLKPLTPYLRRYWKSLAWGGVSTILYNIIKVLIPAVIGHAVDDMQHGITQQKILFHGLRLPHLTGFILCGAIFGPEVLGLLTKPMITGRAATLLERS